MSEAHLPNLTFPMVNLGENETPWDLARLLYRGGAACRINLAAHKIASGKLGFPLLERLSLVESLHEEMASRLVAGGSKHTAHIQFESLRNFFTWAEMANKPLTIEDIEATYLNWTDSLHHQIQVKKTIQHITGYRHAAVVGGLLDHVLERARPILTTTALRRKKRVRSMSVAADKQNLEETFEFGKLLADICDALTIKSIFGPLPVRVPLRRGGELLELNGLRSCSESSEQKTRQQRYQAKLSEKVRAALAEPDIDKRSSVINTRVEAELLTFISQTGMNLLQAQTLTLRQFSYKSSIDGYLVRDYKHRRHGEVLFEIFSDYKDLFERYLAWRNAVFPEGYSNLLFPFAGKRGRADDKLYKFWRIRRYCKKLDMRFVPPARLRKTRINWLLRRSHDLDLTAEISQHSKEVLVGVYEQPNHQAALSEITRFWIETDPTLPSPTNGLCDGIPSPDAEIPDKALQPDCLHPSGCLWCDHHRDIDSFDYVWSLSSMRHLKTIALSGFLPCHKNTLSPARHIELTIDRLSAKLRWFEQSNNMRHGWVKESLIRIDEGHYHSHWQYLIDSLEKT